MKYWNHNDDDDSTPLQPPSLHEYSQADLSVSRNLDNSTIRAFRTIVKHEGWRALYKVRVRLVLGRI